MCKRILAITLCLIMILAVVSCNRGDDPAATTEATTTTEAPVTTESLVSLEEYLSTVTYRSFEPTGSSAPYFVGRWFEKEIDGTPHMVTLTSGSHLYFAIDGAESFDVDFTVITKSKTPPTFAYSIDGGTPVRQLITEKTVALPDSGYHTVRIIADGMYEMEGKWVEERGFALKGITASDGGSIYGIQPKSKVVFYYGDSITEGIYALGKDSKNNSAVNSYTWHSAEKLGITPYFIGYGGTGFTQGVNEGKSFATMIEAIDNLSKDRPLEDEIIPDVIVISHGTNELWTKNDVLMEAAKKTIDRLNEKYPNTPIIYLGIENPANGKLPVCRMIANSYDNITWVSSEGWGVTFNYDDCHPDAKGAKVLGEGLADAMIKILGEDFFN